MLPGSPQLFVTWPEKKDFHSKMREPPGEFWIWGLGSIFTVIVGKRVARKLCRIILLYFGPITFRFHFGISPKTHHVHDFSDSWTCPCFPKPIVLALETQDRSRLIFKNMICKILKYWESILLNCLERRVPKSPGDPSCTFLKVLNMGSIPISPTRVGY